MDMKKWLAEQIAAPRKKALPILSFPCITLMDITVRELIEDSDLQARGMKMVSEQIDSAGAVSMMDLSVEADAFGSTIRVFDDEVPTVVGSIVSSEEDVEKQAVPAVGAGRTGKYIEAIRKACDLITDRPVLAGVIGPFSLAGRLMDVSEAMVNCIEKPDMVHATMRKATDFVVEYIKAYKAVGANGVVMAEPLTGLLSPRLAARFSAPYVREINEAVQSDDFIVIYHNCGNNTIKMIDSILSTGSDAYHFGNAIDMAEMMAHIPADTIAMGNVDPSSQFRNGTPESIYADTQHVMSACCPNYPNFVISSGCDIPAMSPWENINAFFKAVDDYYTAQGL